MALGISVVVQAWGSEFKSLAPHLTGYGNGMSLRADKFWGRGGACCPSSLALMEPWVPPGSVKNPVVKE